MTVAEDVNPRLDREHAIRLWRAIGESPCAKKLGPDERRWLDLFESTGRRDTAAMSRTGLVLLDRTAGRPAPSSEYVFFAAVTGLVCEGDFKRARDLLQQGADKWVRSGVRLTELRYLDALTRPSRDARRVEACPGAARS